VCVSANTRRSHLVVLVSGWLGSRVMVRFRVGAKVRVIGVSVRLGLGLGLGFPLNKSCSSLTASTISTLSRFVVNRSSTIHSFSVLRDVRVRVRVRVDVAVEVVCSKG
jgi:hypothetical protein